MLHSANHHPPQKQLNSLFCLLPQQCNLHDCCPSRQPGVKAAPPTWSVEGFSLPAGGSGSEMAHIFHEIVSGSTGNKTWVYEICKSVLQRHNFFGIGANSFELIPDC